MKLDEIEVILIGDSIRLGYQPYVQVELEEFATVWGPEVNGGSSENVLNHLDEWVLSKNADVVHLNAGLHDLNKPVAGTVNTITLGQYRQNVETILKTILDRSDARLIWATTTPVRENRQSFRVEADVLAYNEAATEIATNLGVEINDLFQVVSEAGRDRLLLPGDDVHYTEEGSRILAKAVAGFIRR